jgi:hypothetical protein
MVNQTFLSVPRKRFERVSAGTGGAKATVSNAGITFAQNVSRGCLRP